MSLSLILDAAIVVLLMITIVYAAILNRRLSTFRNARNEFSDLIESFNESTSATEALLAQVKTVASAGNGNLNRRQFNQQLQKGQDLAGDLKFLLQRGDELANRLAGEAQSSRPARRPHLAGIVDTVKAPRGAGGAANGGEADIGRSRAETELLQALKAVR